MRYSAYLATGLAAVAASCGVAEQYQGKKLAARELIDPSSAQFRDVKTAGGFVCGEINGKNRMGGYAGFQRFIADLERDQVVLAPEAIAEDDVNEMNVGTVYEGVTFNLRWSVECVSGTRLLE